MTASIILPRDHGSLVCDPSTQSIPAIVSQNRDFFAGLSLDLRGKQFAELRSWTRELLVKHAVAYTQSLITTDGPAIDPEWKLTSPIIVTGHQPELFHVGVWAKNYAASAWALSCGGTSLNLVVDSDTLDSTTIRVPTGNATKPAIELVPFDLSRIACPWEEASVLDESVFHGFGPRVSSIIESNWKYRPIIADCWSAATSTIKSRGRLCDALTAVRVHAERCSGLNNLEIPLSMICETEPFRWFASILLTESSRFRTSYNSAVAEYRVAHRLHSQTHPVPDLEVDGDWYEVPFWLWSQGDVRRERPFVRRAGSQFELRTSRGIVSRWDQSDGSSVTATTLMLADLSARGYRFRTRALTTTLFTRLFLADLFIHGIGGAKYDEMTDRLCEGFFGFKAPAFATVSATFHLPMGGGSSVTAADERRLLRLQRDLRYNPDRHTIPQWGTPEAELVSTKQGLVTSLQGRRPTAAETRKIERINKELQPFIEETASECESELQMIRQKIAAQSIIHDREFAWVLHPQDRICMGLKSLFETVPLNG